MRTWCIRWKKKTCVSASVNSSLNTQPLWSMSAATKARSMALLWRRNFILSIRPATDHALTNPQRIGTKMQLHCAVWKFPLEWPIQKKNDSSSKIRPPWLTVSEFDLGQPPTMFGINCSEEFPLSYTPTRGSVRELTHMQRNAFDDTVELLNRLGRRCDLLYTPDKQGPPSVLAVGSQEVVAVVMTVHPQLAGPALLPPR